VTEARLDADPVGLHRVLEPAGVLPQAATRLDTRRELWPDEIRIRVKRLNLDAASFRQLEQKHDGDGDAVRAEVLAIVAARGKMQNPVTGSGGMLVGTVEEVGEESPLGLAVGDEVATLVSLTLTPLVIEDALARWAAGRPGAGAGARGDGRVRRPGADRPCRRGVHRPHRRRHRRSG
jgi:L-erythro-3,5-diaminohexanoate dehydrogenase